MSTHNNQTIRLLATIYMRKVISKLFMQLPEADQATTKNLLLERFVAEPVGVLKKNIADVIGKLGKILIPNGQWPELFQIVFQYTQSDDLTQKELAMMLLSVMIEYFSLEEITTYYEQLNPIIMQYLQSDHESLKRLAVITVNNLTQTGHAQKVLKKHQELIPLMLNAINIEQEDLIQSVFETLSDFLETPKILKPHLQMLFQGTVNLAQNTDLGINIRSITLLFLQELGDAFSKQMIKKDPNTIKQVIRCGFRVACEDTAGFQNEEESPHSYALTLLFIYACMIPNEIAYDIYKPLITELSESDDPLHVKAGLKILGIVCNNDALLDPIKEDIDMWTDRIVEGLQNDD